MSVQQSSIVGPLTEPEDQGGLDYYRCTACGREALYEDDVHRFVTCEGESA